MRLSTSETGVLDEGRRNSYVAKNARGRSRLKRKAQTHSRRRKRDVLAAPNRKLARYNALDPTHPGVLMSVPDINGHGGSMSSTAQWRTTPKRQQQHGCDNEQHGKTETAKAKAYKA